MKKPFTILSSPAFIIGLLLLLLNDFYLKTAVGNVLTGKLSDFAGMFIFPLFWYALFPKQKRLIFMVSGLFFIWWKSPFSQGLIDAWNGFGIYQIGRIVDASDLIALAIMPVGWRYTRFWGGGSLTADVEKRHAFSLPRRPKPRFQLHPVIPLMVACFAFVATSQKEPTGYFELKNTKYNFKVSEMALKKNLFFFSEIDFYNPMGTYRYDPRIMARCSREQVLDTMQTDSLKAIRTAYDTIYWNEITGTALLDNDFQIGWKESECLKIVSFELSIEGNQDTSTVLPQSIFFFHGYQDDCPPKVDSLDKYLIKLFEEKVITPLRQQ
ncbi:MAG: hypothetical protein AB8F95_01795 [Bacteroidia bacterium]